MLPAKPPKRNKLAATYMQEKPVDLVNDVARASTLAPPLILLFWVPLQKFPFLFNLQFLAL